MTSRVEVSEIASIHAQIETFVLALGGRVRRIHDALDHLRHETELRFRLSSRDPAEVDAWLDAERFAVDADGFFQSAAKREAHGAKSLGEDAVTEFWSARDRDDPEARARLHALRDVGARLLEIQRDQPGVAWIYYQDVTNTAVVFPYFDLVTILPSTFDWRAYHTFVSVTGDAASARGASGASTDHGRRVRWTPPNIDYGGEGLITSASIPVRHEGRLVGVWSIDVPLRTIHRNCIHEHIAPEQHNFIVDLEGFIVDHESIAVEIDKAHGSILRKGLADLGGDFCTLDLKALARAGSGTLELLGADGQPLLVTYRVVPELDWIFFGTFPKNQMVAARNAKELAALHADLKERERAETALRRAKVDAEAANAAKDRFIATLSHELRTPLSPVLGAVSWLQRDPRVPAAIQPTLELIRRNVVLEARLIDDLLDVNAITRGQVTLVRSHVDMHDIVRRSAEISAEELARGGVTLAFDFEATEHHVDGDSARLQQALWSVLRNAVNVTAEGGAVRIRTTNPRPGRFRVDVTDTGIGLAPEDLGRIFDAFEQAGPRERGGLGIGLTIARAVASAHGGTLEAASPGIGGGATFALELDAALPPGPQSEQKITAKAAGPLRLLVVEDNADAAEVLVAALELLGHEVRGAANARDALALCAVERFDLVISDLGLPDLNGCDLLRRMRERGDVLAIALSGYGLPEDVERSLEAGFVRHLTKPVELAQLEEAVNDVLARFGPATRPALAT